MHDALNLSAYPCIRSFRPELFQTMQIQYCDACGTRVEDTEAVHIAGKYYCQQCAPKHVPAQKAGGTAVIVSPRGTTRAQRQAPPGSGSINTRFTGSKDPEPSRETRHFPSARDRAAPKPGSVDSAFKWAAENPPLAILLAAGILGIFIFALWSISNSGEKPVTSVSNPKTTKDSTSRTTQISTAGIKATTLPSTTPLVSKSTDPDPRTDKAVRDLKAIKESIAAGNANPFDVRKKLEKLIEPFWIKKTPIGVEATLLLQKFKAEKRLPDKADGATPGVTVAVSNEFADEAFNTNFNPVDIKTIPDINIPNEGALKAAFGRDSHIALKFTGFINVPADGEYTFYISSDDGSMLYIGDTVLINNAGEHQMTEQEGKLDFKAGKHAFRIEYYQGMGQAGMIFSWSGPGLGKQIVPASALSTIPRK